MDVEHFNRYTSWFHDGDIVNINHHVSKNLLVITMASAEIIGWKEFDHKIELSKDHRIVGKLHIERVEEISLNEELYKGQIEKKCEIGEIVRFHILDLHLISLSVIWRIKDLEDYSLIRIKADKIWWENIPELNVSLHYNFLDKNGEAVSKGDDSSHLYSNDPKK